MLLWVIIILAIAAFIGLISLTGLSGTFTAVAQFMLQIIVLLIAFGMIASMIFKGRFKHYK